jgi:outer membrane protein
MKKYILSFLAVVAFGTANAQEATSESGFAKGDLFISGALTLSSSKTGDFKVNFFEVAPRVGYFVTDKIALGASIGFQSEKLDIYGSDASNAGIGLGVFGRYYFTPANKFSLFAEFGIEYTSFDNEYFIVDGELVLLPGPESSIKSNEIGLGLGFGMNYFVSSNFSIEAVVGVLGYTSNDNGGDGADKTNTLSLGGDWRAITLGLNYKF